MTPPEAPTAAAGRAAEAVRSLNHATRPGVADVDVVDAYDMLAELALLAARLPQTFAQIEALVDDLVEHHQVVIINGKQKDDPVAAAVIVGHWLANARAAAGQLAHGLDAAQQALTWAAAANPTNRLGK